MTHRLRRALWICGLLASVSVARTFAQAPVAVRDTPAASGDVAAPGRTPLPPLTPDAQRFVDQWKQDLTNIVDQLRVLQQTYRDTGHAEDAAAIAARVRLLQRSQPSVVTGDATPELVNEGLPSRDAPIAVSSFRDRAGETLSFAVRGRDDQPVWGTTIYTDDSGLETAAVHAGLMRAGQSAIVKVMPLRGQEHYEASNQHGVQSIAYASQKGSFRFVSASIVTPRRTPSLSSYRDLIGQSVVVPVVGAVAGGVWGTDVYTDDSSIAVAAVHAGLAQPGELGFVKLTLLPGQEQYDGSSRNGVNSENFGTFSGSFRLEPTVESSPVIQWSGGDDASRLVALGTLRGRTGLSIVVQVVGSGSEGGPVWGSDVYTDDSPVAVAAVHAGLLKRGETGVIRVTLVRGRQSYPGSMRNGVHSLDYGAHSGSYRLERVK